MVNWSFVGAMFLPNVGGWISTLTMVGQVKKPDGTGWYQSLRKPSWTPPNWVFGPTWTVLYTTMGAASYMVYRDCGGFTDMAVVPLSLYGGQLVLNWIWTPLFFGCHKIGLRRRKAWATWATAYSLAVQGASRLKICLAHIKFRSCPATVGFSHHGCAERCGGRVHVKFRQRQQNGRIYDAAVPTLAVVRYHLELLDMETQQG
ncbi:unnamed protein product [Chilo suppressalis]|uniref:Translocator protein n=1 Tax=Chilo suppressalis TaxID=168631 RepID=A0ABN8B0U3_CHISP|nr:unnamed protein product [Chilo suppressalis]